jgi:hypothetical protein
MQLYVDSDVWPTFFLVKHNDRILSMDFERDQVSIWATDNAPGLRIKHGKSYQEVQRSNAELRKRILTRYKELMARMHIPELLD